MIQTKNLLTTAAAALLATAPLLPAQLLHNPNGTPYAPLFSTAKGHFLGGLDLDAAGNIYYLDTDTDPATTGGDGDLSTRLIQRTPSGVTTTLFTFASENFAFNPFGSFVRVQGTSIFWGESSTGTLWSATLTGGNSLLNTTKLGAINGNYDLAFSPTGEAYLSANPNVFSYENHVYRLTLGSGAISLNSNSVSKIYDASDASGPLTFDAGGSLLYGRAGYNSSGGIYSFTATDLSGNGELALGNQLLLSNGPNRYLISGGGGLLFQVGSDTLFALDLNKGGQQTPLAVTGDYIGNLAVHGGEVYTFVSSGFGKDTQVSVYEVAPEPGTAIFLALGAVALLHRRFRRA